MADLGSSATILLQRIRRGDAAAREELVSRLYSELHQIAEHLMHGERTGHTLQPTALVNEAWMRLCAREQVTSAENHAQFLQLAARAMRRILVDHARRRQAAKRHDGERVDLDVLDVVLQAFEERSLDTLALDEALERLERVDAELARVVELRFYAGLTVAEVAQAMDATVAHVERRWRMARAWLRTRMPRPDQA